MLTVCIPTYNSANHLKKLIDSLNNQSFKKFIVYFADGGSKDDTLAIIKISAFDYKIVSKKDNHIEEGINNCLREVKTKYFSILGSDDNISSDYFEALISVAEQTNCDFIFPSTTMFFDSGDVLSARNDEKFDSLKYKMLAPGIGWVAKSSVLESLMGFSSKYRVASDYEFLCRAYKAGYTFIRSNSVSYSFASGGNSDINKFLGFKEVRDISIVNGCSRLFAYSYYYARLVWHLLSIRKIIMKICKLRGPE